MLCQICQKNNANYFYEETRNGVTKSYALCSECKARLAAEGTLTAEWNQSGEDAGEDLLSLLFSPAGIQRRQAKTCACGTTYAEIRQRGRVGCMECYRTFMKELEPTIRSMHGSTSHIGRAPAQKIKANEPKIAKTPANESVKSNRSNKETQLNDLQTQLKQAIAAEEYEQAAVLRDRILAIKEEQV